jgi:diguanylate cyclase (GGDEF)-like protein
LLNEPKIKELFTMRILLVEDDKSIADAVAAVLTKQHYVVDIAADGQVGWEFAAACNYDLILLDVMLPKLDGISLCRQLRREGYRMPILLLTARDTGTDKVMGLDAGADDYVVKPFDFQELTARIRALLRRGNSTLPPVLEWGNLRLDPSTCEVTYGSQALHLSPKEYGVLELFLRNKQRVFSRSKIIDHLWSFEDPPEEDTIKSHIKGLRQKLKAAGAPTDLIETVYGLGYRLKPLSHGEKCQIQASESEVNWAQEQTMLAVAKAREDFKAGISERLAVLEQATNALRESKLGDQLRSTAEQEAHKLAGSLGSFGFAQGSRLAQEIEQMLQTRNFLEQAQSLRLCELVMELHRELEQTPDELTHIKPLSSEQRPRLLIVSDDTQLIEQLVLKAAMRKMQVETAVDTAAAPGAFVERTLCAIASLNPDVVLLDLCPNSAKDSLTLLAELSNRLPSVPVMVFTDQNNLTDRVEVARAGGRGFLQKSMPPAQVLELVTQVLQRVRATESRVMVVDDDPQVLSIIQNLMEPWGIKLTTLEDPRRFWDILTEFCPDLLILDVKMPHLNGIELCQVIRNDPRWSELPVLFLTAHTDADTVEQIFAAGADDCVDKPIVGPKLVTRIFNRLERTQLLRRMAETDALTGVANRRKLTQELGQFLRLAEHHNQFLCLAILDIDHFKQANDQYGYAAGDEVLRRLGGLLQRTFQSLEVVGRWGDAEFVVGMYGMTKNDGVKRSLEVLEALRQQVFTGSDGTKFQLTFSIGIAQYPEDGIDLQTLYKAADKALQQSKATGDR